MEKRKTNPLYEKIINRIPQEVIDKVEKAMTCEYLINGDECKLGGNCVPESCEKWKLAEWVKSKRQEK